MIKTPLRGRKDPLKFTSLPTCGFVAHLVERPTSIREARVQALSKPDFFSGFLFCNFFNCSLPARINSLLITRRSKYDLFHILFVIKLLSLLYFRPCHARLAQACVRWSGRTNKPTFLELDEFTKFSWV